MCWATSHKREVLRVFLIYSGFCGTGNVQMRIVLIRFAWAGGGQQGDHHLATRKQMFRLANSLIYIELSGNDWRMNSYRLKLYQIACKLLNANDIENDSHWYLGIVRSRKGVARKIALSTPSNGAVFWPKRMMCMDIFGLLITGRGCVEINWVYRIRIGVFWWKIALFFGE